MRPVGVPFEKASTSTTPANSHRNNGGAQVTGLVAPAQDCTIRIAVGIATRSRPSVLIDTLANLQWQTLQPERILVAFTETSDLGDARERFPGVLFLQSAPGLTRQRNRILAELTEEDIVVFLDDDFHVHPNYLAVTQKVFRSHPNVVATTGTLLADGINGPGLSTTHADALIHSWASPKNAGDFTRVFNTYGCNMGLRLSEIRNRNLAFDEALPLYGWYEDVAFSRQLAPFGKIVRVLGAAGVHLGVKSGRQSGIRLGYSQVANPFYLARKGLVSWTYAISSMCSRTVKNLVRSAYPEPWVDRQGRLRGNFLGWSSLLTGTADPTRILDL